jgi:two-component system nitrate/nitrite sensor histidine kinase NarX
MYASGVNFQLNNSLETNYKLTPNSALNVLRIIQESIHNALKYAQAENIFIHFENSGNGIDNEINITILDDGIGFTMSEVEKSGLMIMQNRAQKIGAQLDIDTKPGKGVRISLKLLFPSSGD